MSVAARAAQLILFIAVIDHFHCNNDDEFMCDCNLCVTTMSDDLIDGSFGLFECNNRTISQFNCNIFFLE